MRKLIAFIDLEQLHLYVSEAIHFHDATTTGRYLLNVVNWRWLFVLVKWLKFSFPPVILLP